LQEVPAERQFRLQYETLVQEPPASAEALSGFLGLEFDEGMLRPYEERQKRMTDGIYRVSESRMIGDVKFHGYSQIETKAADRWKDEIGEDFLSEMTWDLAEEVGYERPSVAGEMNAETAEDLLGRLDELSDDEVAALLGRML
jgi:hypothetical protein